ncbi:hypothetical protein [Actinocorallia sp. A-T 12471]|uniref:hypothetical protein n=1 Tax=Actinocorallia sp. A-T 12471 TaxID=3089813 RepID=UPI0029D1BC5D|nr:hypothetical protein [Actinocorallia sp. A-T 12471]MDX6738819.1 hypothetical protein [Actinocorallia sp. A-T 12471]
MSGISPEEALAQIGRTQQNAYTRQQLPLWYPAGFAALMTLSQIGLDDEFGWRFFVLGIGGLAAMGALVSLLLNRWAKVRWTKETWTPSASITYVVWLLAAAGLALGAHFLVFDGLAEPGRKLAAGAVAVVYLLATTRPAEALIIRLSKAKVVS